ncbi:MAG: L,D-transpeptidase [Clostridia bacterium]|nr:L,D-transpeptidase [Clostridia bacterium]
MSDRNYNDAFDLLNSEFANHELEKQNAKNLENLRKRQQMQQKKQESMTVQDDFYDEDDESGGRGCIGTALRIFLILLLAGAIAWIVFMPAGSLNELWNKASPELESAVTWITGFFAGSSEKESRNSIDGQSDSEESIDYQDGPVDMPDGSDIDNTATPDESASTDESTDQIADTGDSPYSITVFRPSQIVIIYDSAGNPVKIFSCSSGKDSTPTKLGNYAIRAKYRWRFMVGNCYTQYASSFSTGYLFHSIPYNKKNAGTMSDSSYDKLGNPASSGCVRLCFRDSKWIYDNCPIGTKVSVVDEKAPAGSVPEIIPERIKDSAHSGWDPTDDSPDSPYNK